MSFRKQCCRTQMRRESTLDSGCSTDYCCDEDTISVDVTSCDHKDQTVPMPGRITVIAPGSTLVPSANSVFKPILPRDDASTEKSGCISPSCRCVTSVKKGKCTHHRPCTPIHSTKDARVPVDAFEEEYLTQAVRSTYSMSDYEDSDDGDSAPYTKLIRFPRRSRHLAEKTASNSGKSEDYGFFDSSVQGHMLRAAVNPRSSRVADWISRQVNEEPATLV